MNQLYEWKYAEIGGGGYITGLLQDPFHSAKWYARCDVAGVFVSEDGGRSWKARNSGTRLSHHHSVQSFCASPHEPEVLFRCSGEARGMDLIGTIHKSTDGGSTWREVTSELDFYGNGPTRMYGEVIAVDPYVQSNMAAGAYSKGLWMSRDGGEQWTYAGLTGERISCVSYHPFKRGVLYAGTIGDSGLGDSEERLHDYLNLLHDKPRGSQGKLYCSYNDGTDWEVLLTGPHIGELYWDEAGILYAACLEQGIKLSLDEGRTWVESGRGLPSSYLYGTITGVGQFLYTAADVRPHHQDAPPIAVYRSMDAGESWNLVRMHEERDLAGYPGYMDVRYAGWAIAKLRIDRNDAERVLMTNWYGVSVSADGGAGWHANGFTGLGTICGEHIQTLAAEPGSVLATLADHPPKISRDGGQTYRTLPAVQGYSNSTAACASALQPGVILYGLKGEAGSCIVKWSGGLERPQPSIIWPEGTFVQCLVQDYQAAGTFYAYVDGEVEKGAGLYRTKDEGLTWYRLSFPVAAKELPIDRYWIEAELLSVVVYQVKNVCGTNQLLYAHPQKAETLYLGEHTEGLFVTEDGGESWRSIGEGLPFGRERASVLNCIAVYDNTIYAGFVREGLWRSADGGLTWDKLYPASAETGFNATSIAVNESGIYVASEPMYWSPSESVILRSADNDKTWDPIYDSAQLGALRWKSIAVDAEGTLHGVTCGNGIIYGQCSV